MPQRIVVFGGCGFLGSLVTRWLADRGHFLRVFDLRLPSPAAAVRAGNVEYVEGNFLNRRDVESALRGGYETVLHFISVTVPATSIDNVPVEIESNVAATVHLLDSMAMQGIRRIGFPSSGGTVYAASDLPHGEEEAPRPTCPYGLGKLLVEDVLRFYRDFRSIEFQIWRIANAYGDVTKLHTAQGVIDAFLHRLHAGHPISVWGEGTAVRDFVFGEDVAAAIGMLLEGDAWNQVVNVGTGKGASIADVLDAMRAVIPRPIQVHRMDAYSGPPRAVLDGSKLRRLTGWSPRYDLAAGIAEAWRRLATADP